MTKYIVNWGLSGVAKGKTLHEGDTVDLTDDQVKVLGLDGSGVLTKVAEAKKESVAEKAAREAAAKKAAEELEVARKAAGGT